MFNSDVQWFDVSSPDYDPKYPWGKDKKMVFVDSKGIIKSDTWEEGLVFKVVAKDKKVGEKWK